MNQGTTPPHPRRRICLRSGLDRSVGSASTLGYYYLYVRTSSEQTEIFRKGQEKSVEQHTVVIKPQRRSADRVVIAAGR